MGTDGDPNVDGDKAQIAFNSTTNQYLVVWEGDDINGEQEIYGQLINATTGAEIGSDFRISNMVSSGTVDFRASRPSVAYNVTNNEFLVVWSGDTNSGSLINDDVEIFGQRISATGTEIGSDFRISDANGTGNILGIATNPKVVWNAADNEYLVVWAATDPEIGLVYLEYEIFGQRLSNTGVEIGTNDFKISDMAGSGAQDPDALNPDVAWNSTDNNYMVVWQGSESTSNGIEIYAQRLSNTGAEIGTNDFVISDMGDSNTDYAASNPEIAYNATDNEYMVVWQSDDNTSPLVNNENEIFGQRLSSLGAEIGSDFRISTMGDDTETNPSTRDNFRAGQPEIAWSSSNNVYMVVWEGEDDTEALGDGEVEIFGRILSNTSALLGSQLRLSNLGGEGNSNYDAGYPALAHDTSGNCLIVFEGDNQLGTLFDNEEEIWGQRFTISTANSTPLEIFANPPTIESGTTTGIKISDLFTVDADQSNTFTYTLVAGTGSTDNTSFTISGSDLVANTSFDFSTKATYNIRVEVNDGTNSFQQALTLTVNEPVTTLVGNEFRISVMGTDGDDALDASNPDLAYNSTDDEFLVVWHGDNTVSGKNEIFGQRVNASDGTLLGAQFLISNNVSGNADFDASDSRVAYNSVNNQYLVVWESDDNTGGMIDNETEIFGRIVNANGTLSGSQIRVSDVGGSGNTTYTATDPDVAYSATSNVFLVTWDADDSDAGFPDNKREIFGQVINNLGAETGTNDFRISTTGSSTDDGLDANDPQVDWNSTDNEFLVVWDADVTAGHNKAYGQRISTTGAEIGADFEIIAGSTADNDADKVSVAYNSVDNQYMVICELDQVLNGKNEVYTQIVSNTGAKVGILNKVSDHVTGNANFDANDVSIAYIPDAGEYITTWEGESDQGGLIDNEFEVFLQRLTNANIEEGVDDERISQVGGTGDNNQRAQSSRVAYSTNSKVALVIWHGDPATNGLSDNETEIFGQLWRVPVPVDNTAPIFENSTPTSSAVAQTSFTLETDIDEAGTIYYVVVSDGATEPSAAEVKAGTGSGGSGQITTGNATVTTGEFTNNFNITGLTAGTAYDIYVVAEDDESSPNLQVSPTKIDVATASLISLTVTGLIGDDKVYDDTAAASATGTAVLSGVVGGDDVILGGSPTFTFASANVGVGITINATGYTISGADVGKYLLIQPTLSADITAKELTITGLTGDDKVYDDTAAASATGTAVLSGVETGDDVSLGGAPTFTFASANVGTGITVNTSGYTISGTDSGNYTLTQPTLSADITAKELTITGLTGDDKVYDDTAAASATGTAVLSGVETGDDVSLGGAPTFTFASANVGTGITVNTSGYTISGTDSGNYTLTQPTLSADITAKELTITGLTGDDKVEDGTTAATATGTAVLNGVETGDDVSLGGSPVFTFASPNVGTNISIATTGYTISGTDSGNYTLTQPTLSADITSTLGLEEVSLRNLISLYPNPFENELFFDIANNIQIENVKVYSITGQLLRSYKGVDKKINLSNLANGVYIIAINSNEGSITKRMVKK
ncbi:conserved hypothetical protein-possibly heme/hemopexin utilization protein huxA [Jejuia pallidilutea]|uniref:Cadherin domain-containing protein n=6 Tax=Jejuia pallidilutea TaxID=504487 RepID=A0A098LM00_9FLAO|nr:conserved hypothetical protein-possibly heme/hemopexin utilization protein huxA [Jejuia pallidilutea]